MCIYGKQVEKKILWRTKFLRQMLSLNNFVEGTVEGLDSR